MATSSAKDIHLATVVRLSPVNLYLHGFTDPHLYEYDTLTSEERWNDFALTPRRSRHNCHCRTGSPVALLLRALFDPFQMLVVGDRRATDIVDDHAAIGVRIDP